MIKKIIFIVLFLGIVGICFAENYKTLINNGRLALNSISNLNSNTTDKSFLDTAIKDFQDAISLHPNRVDGYYYLGIAYSKKGWFKEARKSLKKAIKLNYNSPECHYAYACALLDSSYTESAIKEFHKAYRLAPNSYIGEKSLRKYKQLLQNSKNKGFLKLNPH
ncbi:MAG: tetratricopeptide repeat protein [Candidatus Omnitrophica bacterium]|nr:tetratricopeptide repeat protein [Candidatus Omnitrophota bacterium]